MVRLLAAVGLILGMVLALDRAAAFGLGEALRHAPDRFMAIYRDGPAADVVILGNSRADNVFPADAVGALTCGTALNLGMGGAPTTVNDLIWEDYLDHHGAPRLLLIEPTAVVDDPAALADAPLLAHFSDRVDNFVHTVDPTMWASNRLFHTLIFNSNQTLRVAFDSLRPRTARTLTGSLSPFLKAEIAAAPDEAMVGHAANWAALERIVTTARQRGTRVAVVIAPYLPAYARKVTNFDAFFDALARRLPPDVPVLDARRAVPDDAEFMDALHVNEDGVRRMLAALAPALQRVGGCAGDAIAQLGVQPVSATLALPAPGR